MLAQTLLRSLLGKLFKDEVSSDGRRRAWSNGKLETKDAGRINEDVFLRSRKEQPPIEVVEHVLTDDVRVRAFRRGIRASSGRATHGRSCRVSHGAVDDRREA